MYNKIIIFLASLLFLGLVASCAEDDNNPADNNDDNNNNNSEYSADVSATLDGNDLNYQFAAAAYNAEEDVTYIILTNSADGIEDDRNSIAGESILIYVNGKGTDLFTINGTEVGIAMNYNGTYFASSGSIEITRFDDPGGKCVFNVDANMASTSGSELKNLVIPVGTEVSVFNYSVFDDNGDDDSDDGDDGDDGDLNQFLKELTLEMGFEEFDFSSVSGVTAVYEPNNNLTTILVNGMATHKGNEYATQIGISFTGKDTGIVELNKEEDGSNIAFLNLNNTFYYFNDGTELNINSYGEVGDNIDLNLNGTISTSNGSSIKTIQKLKLVVERQY